MKIKCLIIDDEPLAQRIIEKYCKDISTLEIIEKCKSAFEAMELLYNKQIDLIFLDINMPKMSGIDFLKSLKNPPLVIFTTAYREYALESYDLDVIDYLKKPFSFERFFKAIQKVQEKIKSKNTQRLEINSTTQTSNEDKFIFVKSDKKIRKLNFSDILYVEALGDYIKIYIKNSNLVIYNTLKNIEKLLPENKFKRIHKSYIISIDKIKTIEGNRIFINNFEVPIGKNYKKSFLAYLNSSKSTY